MWFLYSKERLLTQHVTAGPFLDFFGWGLGTRLGLPCFFLFFSLHSYTDARKQRKCVRPVMWRRHKVDVGGTVSDHKYVCNKPESEFLTSQTEHSQSCEHLGSCLVTECSMMKVWYVWPLPPYIHLAHSRISVPVFRRSSASVYCTDHKPKNEKREGLRMRLLSVLMRERMTCQPTTVQVLLLC